MKKRKIKLNKTSERKLKKASMPIKTTKSLVHRKSGFEFEDDFIAKLAKDIDVFVDRRIKDSEQLAWYDTRTKNLKGEYIEFLRKFDEDNNLDGLNLLKYYALMFTGKTQFLVSNYENHSNKKFFSKMAVYLTDSCNMTCEGCNVRNRPRKGKLGFKEWKSILKTCSEVSDYVVLFGGEPTIFPHLGKIIKYLNEIDMDYAIITNGKRLVEDNKYFKKFMSWNPKNVTFSINHYKKSGKDTDFFKKTLYGYDLLDKLENYGYDGDITANFTINRYNYSHLYKMVKEFSDRGVWSILTPFHSMDGFFTADGVDKMVVPITDKKLKINYKLNNQFDKLIKNYDNLKIHAPIEWFEWAKENMLKFNWKCDYEHANYASVDSKGCIQFCHNLRPSTLAFENYVDGRKKFEDEYIDINSVLYEQYARATKTKIKQCRGCSFDHAWSCQFYKQNNQLNRAKRDFNHER